METKEKVNELPFIESLYECSICGNQVETVETIDGQAICPDCLCENTFECARCGYAHMVDDSHTTVDGEVCKGCFDRYELCNECNEYHRRNNMRTYRYNYYCYDCFDELFAICSDCGTVVLVDEIYITEDCCNLCESCYYAYEARINKPVHGYSYKPDAEFHGEGKLFFGAEIEVIAKGDYSSACQTIQDKLSDFVYLKEDGSLDNNGVEIVTHPFSIEYMRENKPFNKLKGLPCYSYCNDSTGLHIHISRRYLKRLDVTKLVAFFAMDSTQTLIRLVCQRDYNHYCKKPKSKLARGYEISTDRYHIVNITNMETVEIRGFKGNCAPNAVYRAVEFCHCLVHFVKDYSVCQFNEVNFLQFMRAGNYPVLTDYISNKLGVTSELDNN